MNRCPGHEDKAAAEHRERVKNGDRDADNQGVGIPQQKEPERQNQRDESQNKELRPQISRPAAVQICENRSEHGSLFQAAQHAAVIFHILDHHQSGDEDDQHHPENRRSSGGKLQCFCGQSRQDIRLDALEKYSHRAFHHSHDRAVLQAEDAVAAGADSADAFRQEGLIYGEILKEGNQLVDQRTSQIKGSDQKCGEEGGQHQSASGEYGEVQPAVQQPHGRIQQHREQSGDAEGHDKREKKAEQQENDQGGRGKLQAVPDHFLPAGGRAGG